MQLRITDHRPIRPKGSHRFVNVYTTPSGVQVVKRCGYYYPITRDGQIHSKRRFAGTIDEYEVWEHVGKHRRVSVMTKEIGGNDDRY